MRENEIVSEFVRALRKHYESDHLLNVAEIYWGKSEYI